MEVKGIPPCHYLVGLHNSRNGHPFLEESLHRIECRFEILDLLGV